MSTWALHHKFRVFGLQSNWKILLLVLFVTNSVFGNDKYSIVEEHRSCDHIIPRFIEQIMSQKSPNCDEPGSFPQPGNCSVFFKCVQSGKGRIQPFIEYCTNGYIFVNGVCMLSRNSSDCPQFTCRIPDGTNEIGNEVEAGNDSNEKVEPTPHFISTSTSSTTEHAEKDVDENENSAKTSHAQDEAFLADPVHSEQLSQTESEKVAEASSKSAGSVPLISTLLASSCILFMFLYHS